MPSAESASTVGVVSGIDAPRCSVTRPAVERRVRTVTAPADRSAGRRAGRTIADSAPSRLGLTDAAFLAGSLGTTTTLLALNEAHGEAFYDVPAEAATDQAAADAVFASTGPVIDVQTHLVRPSRATTEAAHALFGFLRMVEPERWSEPVDLSQLSAPAWAACVRWSETSVALLTSTPGVPGQNVIDNADIAAAREIVDRYTGTGRVLGHTIVHPNIGPSELEAMETWRDELKPAGWKVYTLWDPPDHPGRGWFLDDERWGLPFLERVRATRTAARRPTRKGTRRVPSPTRRPRPRHRRATSVQRHRASPRRFTFVVYHSGYDARSAPARKARHDPTTGATARRRAGSCAA